MTDTSDSQTTDQPVVQERLETRTLTLSDHGQLERIMEVVYQSIGGSWSNDEYRAQLARFPAGQIGIFDGEQMVAAALAIIVDYDQFSRHHTYENVTGDASFDTHDPEGDALYGIDLFVDPEYRGIRLGRRLYDARKRLCEELGLRAILAGGRLPGFAAHSSSMSAREYISQVQKRDIHDPILSFQLANGFRVKRLLKGYMPEDAKSRGYATLLEWPNIDWLPQSETSLKRRADHCRLGLVQWQMRNMSSVDDLMEQVEFFVDALADYRCDIAMLPELFSVPLMAEATQYHPRDAFRLLATHSEEIRDRCQQLALSYNINILAGSLPTLGDDEKIYNTAFFCHRDGSVSLQRKLHPTPDEREYWVVNGGDKLAVIETDAGRVGILICYDVEFPELPRLLADQGMDMLLVPFWTDTKNGYQRVRHCAQARAIENECYVAIAGSVGNLPKVENADIQYAQSAVFSPSDFAFPHDAIMAESTPNTEMTLIVDLDLTRLRTLHQKGSVRNLKDRRLDLFELRWKGVD